MFDLMRMGNSPQAQEMFFRMMAQQMGQAPPEIREAISKVDVIIKKGDRGLELRIGRTTNERVEGMISQSVDAWVNMLSRGFQAMGYKVRIYE